MEAAFYSDDLDDLRGVDPFAPEPPLVPFSLPYSAGREAVRFSPVASMLKKFRRQRGLIGPEHGGVLDMGFLLACNELAPEKFGDLVAWRTGARPSTAVESYRHVNGARNALRHTLHQTGVL